MIEIVEILGRADNGVTEPFICKGDDNNIYYVKGMGVGVKSLVHEWIAGSLARNMRLPIAPFEIVNIPVDIIEYATISGISSLGAGPAFGSLSQKADCIHFSNIGMIDSKLQQNLLMFDFWVKNSDRTLTPKGGNPNLLWDSRNKKLIIIDHNNAFDGSVDLKYFRELHIFSCCWDELTGDLLARREYELLFDDLLHGWDAIIDSLPEAWLPRAGEIPTATNSG